MAKQLVLVTGGSGYIGSYCIVKLLQAGYRVRTTVRSLKRAADVRAMVKASRQHLPEILHLQRDSRSSHARLLTGSSHQGQLSDPR
jgi:nucleoside-diphosphate-sugar epimerase